MHRVTLLILFALALLAAAGKDLAGRYAGEWKSNGAGGSGAIHMSLQPQADATWKCQVSFHFQGEDIKTTIRTCKVEQTTLEASYDFELENTALRSKITGQWNGKAFEGKYETATVDGGEAIDDGSWNAAPAAGQ
jgi:hypothetical protein